TTPGSSKRIRLENAREAEDEDESAADDVSDDPEASALATQSQVPATRSLGDGHQNGVMDGYDENGYKTGAIVRVKLTDFVTYTTAEFFPGPKLNMVIGPNGTGKSTLVCAICLGLGWGPQVCKEST